MTFTNRQRVGLLLVLSAVVLCVSVIRLIAQVQTFGSTGASFPVPPYLWMEVGNWCAWTVWVAVLVWVVTRVQQESASAMRRTITGVMLAVVPIVMVPILASPVHLLTMRSDGLRQSASHVAQHNLPTNALLGVALVAIALGYASQVRTRHLELTAAGLRAQLAESQLATLRTQMDPHFLFNALNGIAVLARRGQTAPIEKMVTGLSALLRHSLESAGSQLVTLRVDVDALRHYLDVENARFGARLVTTLNVPDALLDRIVPSLLLQPIVENAVRHGFEEGTRPLSIEVTASEVRKTLVLVVSDDGSGLRSRELLSDGIGLGNTRARLAGLYGKNASLLLEPGSDGRGARVTIVIPSSTSAAGVA